MQKSRDIGRLVVVTGVLALLAGCHARHNEGAPPRAEDRFDIEAQPSTIAVPVQADLTALAATLETQVPRTLYTIEKPDQTCVKAKEVDLGIARLKTPKLKCDIVGEVKRGGMTLSGSGHTIVLTMPIHAVVHAQDIGGVLSQETATADATARAEIALSLAPDWTPRGTVNIRYDWTNSPHMDFLGQRIDFTEQANQKLAPVIAKLERELPGQLGKLALRDQVGKAWAGAFTTLSLNRENPPVWMRVTPKALEYGGYEVRGNRLVMNLGLKAVTETFVGNKPADPQPTPLPQVKPLEGQAGQLSFFIPVIADYHELEPVLMKALVKRSARPFTVPGVGDVMAKFTKVTIYGTTRARIAVGVTFEAHDAARRLGGTRGTVWLAGKPVNAPNSRKVGFENLAVTGTTDMTGGDLILRLANASGLNATIAAGLTQNFEHDYDKLLGKIGKAIAEKREGDLLIRSRITATQTGTIAASGQGLYLPVRATGEASVTVAK
ncbi:DUF4403 family protein [Novosphingobium sp. 9]|uniref:DUF4403 family protein n=1 Tax=Novosphingobium sp. 9 TaxID=2025349 RepID=UPI0021B5D251|nr:DUF4403 family protein [Novosphingobium sp. 9]